MFSQIEDISKLLFRIGVVATALVMPLDLLTQGPLKLELIIFILLLQRSIVYLIQKRRWLFTTRELIVSAWPFFTPAVALLLSTLVAGEQQIALAFSVLMISLLGRSWVLSRFSGRIELDLFEKSTLIISLILVLFGYWQFFADILGVPPHFTGLLTSYRAFTAFPFPRVHSFAQEPLFLSNYLLLPLSLLLFRLRQNQGWQLGYMTFFVLSLSLFFSTISRTAIAGLIFVGAIFIIAVWRERLYLLKLLSLVTISIGLTVTMIYSVNALRSLNVPKFGQTESSSLSIFGYHVTDINDGSAKTRYELWPRAIKTFLDHPLLGIGPNNARPFLHPDDFALRKDYRKLQPINNDYLTLLAEQGVLGLLAFLPLLVMLIKISLKVIRQRFKPRAAPYVFTLIAIAVQANGFGAIALLRTWVVIGLVIAAANLKPPPSSTVKP